MKKCTGCGAENSDDSKYCIMCSSPLQQSSMPIQNQAPAEANNDGGDQSVNDNQIVNIVTADTKPAVDESQTFKTVASYLGFVAAIMLLRTIFSFTQMESFNELKGLLILLPDGSPLIAPMQNSLNSFYASLAFTVISAFVGVAAIAFVNIYKKNYTVPGDAALKKRASVFFIVCAVLTALTIIYLITQLTLLFSSLNMYKVMGQKPASKDVLSDVASLIFAVAMVAFSVIAFLKARYLKKQL